MLAAASTADTGSDSETLWAAGTSLFVTLLLYCMKLRSKPHTPRGLAVSGRNVLFQAHPASSSASSHASSQEAKRTAIRCFLAVTDNAYKPPHDPSKHACACVLRKRCLVTRHARHRSTAYRSHNNLLTVALYCRCEVASVA